MAKFSIIAGCLECHGSTPCWRGGRAFMAAHEHGELTGHNIWTTPVPKGVMQHTEIVEPKIVPVSVPSEPAPAPVPTKAPPPAIHPGRLSRRAMCVGKVGHRSAPAAQLAIDNCTFDKEFLNAYHCLYCGKWHVGHLIKPTSPSRPGFSPPRR